MINTTIILIKSNYGNYNGNKSNKIYINNKS